MEQLKQYLDTYLLKDQEYKLVRSLKMLDMKEAHNRLAKIAEQLSIGPFTIRLIVNELQIRIDGIDMSVNVHLAQNGQIRSEESFLKRITSVLDTYILWDAPERREADKIYVSLIMHIIEDADIYEQIRAAYEHREEAKKSLEKCDSDFWSQIVDMWGRLHKVASEWYAKDSIKPGTQIEVLNLKNYTSQIKSVWKITESKSGTKIVFKDNTRIDFEGPRVGKTGTWILSHPEYKPLLEYLRKVEDELEKIKESSDTF